LFNSPGQRGGVANVGYSLSGGQIRHLPRILAGDHHWTCRFFLEYGEVEKKAYGISWPKWENEVTDHARDDYCDGPHGAPELEHNKQAPQLVRRIVADPDDESAWLAYSADLADNGNEADALIVRMFWPALRDSLLTLRSFDSMMADVRRNRTLLHTLAAR